MTELSLRLECGFMFKVASWNLNSVRSRLTHVTAWLKVRELDVLLLQELKGTEFPSEVFKSLGYESVAVTQKAYNGVAILSRHPMKTIAKVLLGDDSDSHARFLEVIIRDIWIVNIYAPNGNPVGSDRFAYKLAWMDRLTQQMIAHSKTDLFEGSFQATVSSATYSAQGSFLTIVLTEKIAAIGTNTIRINDIGPVLGPSLVTALST